MDTCGLFDAPSALKRGATDTAVVPRDGHIDLFTTGSDGVVWSSWWEADPGWQDWFLLS